MTPQQVGRVNQQSKSETPLVSGILQRAAVRAVADKEVEGSEEVELGRLRESWFQHDFSRVPAHSSPPSLPIISNHTHGNQEVVQRVVKFKHPPNKPKANKAHAQGWMSFVQQVEGGLKGSYEQAVKDQNEKAIQKFHIQILEEACKDIPTLDERLKEDSMKQVLVERSIHSDTSNASTKDYTPETRPHMTITFINLGNEGGKPGFHVFVEWDSISDRWKYSEVEATNKAGEDLLKRTKRSVIKKGTTIDKQSSSTITSSPQEKTQLGSNSTYSESNPFLHSSNQNDLLSTVSSYLGKEPSYIITGEAQFIVVHPIIRFITLTTGTPVKVLPRTGPESPWVNVEVQAGNFKGLQGSVREIYISEVDY